MSNNEKEFEVKFQFFLDLYDEDADLERQASINILPISFNLNHKLS